MIEVQMVVSILPLGYGLKYVFLGEAMLNEIEHLCRQA